MFGSRQPASERVEKLLGRVAWMFPQFGFEPVGVGPMKNARVLEAMARLCMVPYLGGRRDEAFEYHLRRAAPPRDSQGMRAAE